jgi:hypothetical protein
MLGALIAIVVANTGAALWFALRLARVQGWPVARMLWEPFLAPGLAVAAGVLGGSLAVRATSGPWPALVVAGGVAAFASGAVLLATRYASWREFARLVRRGAPS